MIQLFHPQIYKEEWLEELSKIFDTRWLGQGPKVEEFEKAFGKKFGYGYCLGVNSGSAALELAYHLIGIGSGDEVLTAVFTCTATNLPLLHREANINFLDINEDFLVNYDDVKKKISNKTKALVVVNLGGLQVDKRIFTIAKRYGVPVVIDAAQSLGISEDYGDYICYSFQAIKHFTTGDGGMLVVRNKQIYNRAKRLRWFGIDREAKKRAGWRCVVNHQMAQEIKEAGYKFHMNDIAATLGLIGLKYTDEILEYRKTLCEAYMKKLSSYRKICGGSYWLFMILSDERDELIRYLRENGIECDLVQLRNDIFEVFGKKKQELPNMNRLEDKYFYLPLHSRITIEDVNYIGETFNKWNSKK
ncbi:MAG TPA: aminotransferase class V-fold PLP-dependent enzyme [Patescibacteria group bacterium]|nr:aminotransferase class V-fold PLP-dependent enzyme [Patescibacteria group bacterium]